MNPMDLTNRQLAAFLVSLFVCAALVALGVAHVELMSTPFALLAPAGGRRSSGGDSMRPPPPKDAPPHTPSVLGRALLRAVMTCALIVALAEACSRPSTPPNAPDVVEAGTVVATDVCSLIEGVDDSGAVRTICATVSEIAQVIAFVLTLRSSGDAAAPRDIASCANLPGTTFCATSAERAKGILFIVRARTARLTLDAATATP